MNKNLRKAIITKSKLKNLYKKERTKQNWNNYKNREIFV